MTTTQAPTATARAQRKTRIGVVTSNKMKKTIVVRIARLVRHPKYDRVIKQANSFKVHDETNSAAIGDWVKIMETRPISRDKRWRLVEILKRASTAPPVPEDDVVQPKPPKAPDTSQETRGA
jgi:small subunit ribosomal protein S17